MNQNLKNKRIFSIGKMHDKEYFKNFSITDDLGRIITKQSKDGSLETNKYLDNSDKFKERIYNDNYTLTNTTFDEETNCIITSVTENGNIISVTHTYLDELGRAYKNIINPNSSDEVIVYFTKVSDDIYEINLENKYINMEYYSNSSIIKEEKTIIVNHDQDDYIHECYYNEKGDLISLLLDNKTNYFEYDENGLLIKQTQYFNDETINKLNGVSSNHPSVILSIDIINIITDR